MIWKTIAYKYDTDHINLRNSSEASPTSILKHRSHQFVEPSNHIFQPFFPY